MTVLVREYGYRIASHRYEIQWTINSKEQCKKMIQRKDLMVKIIQIHMVHSFTLQELSIAESLCMLYFTAHEKSNFVVTVHRIIYKYRVKRRESFSFYNPSRI